MTEQTVTGTIAANDMRNQFLAVWKEIFQYTEGPHYLLDDDNSFFDTLSDITATEANIPVSHQSASLAAQVQHTAYYVEALREGLATNFTAKADWEGSWQVEPVDDAQWRALIGRLNDSYEWVVTLATENTDWSADFIGGAFALVAHSAYHLGEVRQGIGVIRSR